MRTTSIIWTVAGLAILGIGIGWRMNVKLASDAELAKGQAARKGSSPRVVLATAKVQDLVSSVETVGSLESPYVVKLSPKTGGRIEYLKVREGDVVKPTDVLVRIDPSDLRGQVLQQEAAVAEAKSRLAQAKLGQGATDVGVGANITQQGAGLSSAKADLRQVQATNRAQLSAAQSSVLDLSAKLQSARAAQDTAAADLGSAQANLENAKAKLERLRGLYAQGFIASQDVEDARTTVKVQEAACTAAESRVSAAKSAVSSAQAQLESSKSQASIVAQKVQADEAAAKAKVTQASASVQVAQANRSVSPAYRENLSALASSVSVAEAQLAQARSKLADTSLVAGIDGVVTSRDADEGSMVSTGQAVLTVQYLKWLYVNASLPIENSGTVTVGSDVSITIDALPGETFTAKIAEVNPAADPTSRQFGVRVKLDNASSRFKPGMYARLKIITGMTRQATVVPRDAVKTTPDGAAVTLVDDKLKATVSPVKVGVSQTDLVQILEGVKSGDRVVILAYSPVKDGQTVREGEKGGSGKKGKANDGEKSK